MQRWEVWGVTFGSRSGVERGAQGGRGHRGSARRGPQPTAKREKAGRWRTRRRMGGRSAPGRAPGRLGASGRGLRASGRGAGAGRPAGHLNAAAAGRDAPPCTPRPAPSASPQTVGTGRQDAVLLGSGHLVPPHLLQGQLVSGAGDGGAPGWDSFPSAGREPGDPGPGGGRPRCAGAQAPAAAPQEGEPEWLALGHTHKLTHTRAYTHTYTHPADLQGPPRP